jgi:hypothetical protein
MPSRRPVAESAVVQVLLTNTFTHSGFTRLYPSDQLALQCQQNIETDSQSVVKTWRYAVVSISGGSQAGVVGRDG